MTTDLRGDPLPASLAQPPQRTQLHPSGSRRSPNPTSHRIASCKATNKGSSLRQDRNQPDPKPLPPRHSLTLAGRAQCNQNPPPFPRRPSWIASLPSLKKQPPRLLFYSSTSLGFHSLGSRTICSASHLGLLPGTEGAALPPWRRSCLSEERLFCRESCLCALEGTQDACYD